MSRAASEHDGSVLASFVWDRLLQSSLRGVFPQPHQRNDQLSYVYLASPTGPSGVGGPRRSRLNIMLVFMVRVGPLLLPVLPVGLHLC